MLGPSTLPLGVQHGVEEDAHLLIQSSRPVAGSIIAQSVWSVCSWLIDITGIPSAVAALAVDSMSDRVIACPDEILYVPDFPHEYLHWGHTDQSLKLVVDRKVGFI